MTKKIKIRCQRSTSIIVIMLHAVDEPVVLVVTIQLYTWYSQALCDQIMMGSEAGHRTHYRIGRVCYLNLNFDQRSSAFGCS
jgi:hypothetical protein